MKFRKTTDPRRRAGNPRSTKSDAAQALAVLTALTPQAETFLAKSKLRGADAQRALMQILDLVHLFDAPVDRRAAATEGLRVLAHADGELSSFEGAMSAGAEYFALGEFAAGSRAARELLVALPSLGHESAFGSDTLVHLSVVRSAAFARHDLDLLGGERVYERIAEHVAGCKSCSRAVRTQQRIREAS